MPVVQDLNTSWEEKEQREAVFTARATLENMSNVLLEGNAQLQEIVNSGKFDTIPTDLKLALNRWWTIYKDAQSACQADGEIVDIYQWRP